MDLTGASDAVNLYLLSNGFRRFTVCVCVHVCACVRACVRACVHACVRVCATWVNVDYPSLPQITRLPFQFPYYGHLVNTVAVTTGGTV